MKTTSPKPPQGTGSGPTDGALRYRDAGVDIDSGNALVERIKPLAARTRRAGVMGGVGGFGALFELDTERWREPVLVSGTDGVGTKLRLAIDLDRHDTIGIDLVAMCANDVVVQGAEPLFFLDYFATGRLDVEVAERIVSGIARGCELAGAALVGGETAEMPGMYHGDDYDLAGFCVGVVEKSRIIDGGRVAPGDVLIGLAASGPHSNGYSLIRAVLERSGADLDTPIGDRTLADALMAPTRIYVRALLALFEAVPVHACAHITGGGIVENLPRVLPEGTRAVIDPARWQRPPVFDWIEQNGPVPADEMWRTFNCGIGMIVCVPETAVERALEVLAGAGEDARPIGHIAAGAAGQAARVDWT